MSQPAPTPPNSSLPSTAHVTEYSVRVPKNLKNKHHVMRFNYNLNVDFSQWRSVKMERENNNLKESRGIEEETPKFGAGSEYNRDQKEEARRKKFGIIAKKYNPDAQPWILKVGGKLGKKFRGIREGGVSENAAFYVFTHAPDGAIEAYPLHEWYNFQPIQRYKALTAEEAEEEFGRRRKCVNMWTMKMRMKLKNKDEEEPEDPEETKAMKVKGGDKKDLKISELDEWMDSDDMSSSDEEKDEKTRGEDDSDNEAKAKQKKKGKATAAAQKNKKKRDLDDEAFEDSDDGDEEGRELDYISDSSDSESEPETKANKELKSVAEENALRKLLTSDEDSDEEKSNKDNEEDNEDETTRNNNKMEEMLKDHSAPVEKKKDKIKKSKIQKISDALDKGGKPGSNGRSSDFSSDSDDSVAEISNNKKKGFPSNNNSRAGTPIDGGGSTSGANAAANGKRKAEIMNNSDNSNSPQTTPAKKTRPDGPTSVAFNKFSSYSKENSCGITEDDVRRYLMRKPMTTTELLTKFKNKKTGVSSEELVNTMTQILKKINPVKQTIQGKMYLSIKIAK